MHICIGKLVIIGSNNGLLPGRCQAIIWTNAGILLIGTLGTNFSEVLSEIHTFSFKKMPLKMPSGKWRQFCLDLNAWMCLSVGWDYLSHSQISMAAPSDTILTSKENIYHILAYQRHPITHKGVHVTQDFSIVIQIWWKFHSAAPWNFHIAGQRCCCACVKFLRDMIYCKTIQDRRRTPRNPRPP